MRNKRQLYRLMLDNLHLMYGRGLCSVVSKLRDMDKITLEETKLMYKLVCPDVLNPYYPWLFPKGQVKPRREWLEKKIKRLWWLRK